MKRTMDFSRKLARLQRTMSPADNGERKDPVAEVREALDRLIAGHQAELRHKPLHPVANPADRESELPGKAVETRHGWVRMVDAYVEPDHCHGHHSVAAALDVSPGTVAALALDRGLSECAPEGMLYLDTETTGLSGGTGTLPFVIGLGWFEDRAMRVQQLVLQRPGEEGPMLRLVAERVARASCLVTYNGKTFDWPLLATRFVMNRIPEPKVPVHLDLLHCVRRVFKPRLQTARLVDIEAHVLGMHREGDIPGCEIPELYWAFLRGAPGYTLRPVIEHNGNDVIAMAAILGTLAARDDGEDGDDEPIDLLALARVAVRAGDLDRAERFARAAADLEDDRTAIEALLLAARIARSRRAFDRSTLDLQIVLRRSSHLPRLEAEANLALAKLYEHRHHDLDRALDYARLTASIEGPEAHARRIARLERRLERHKAH